MALRTLHVCMRKDQGKARFRMVCHAECGRTPSVYRVTALATPAIGAAGKLSLVGIGFMAIRTSAMRDRHPEIFPIVAFHARHFCVLAQQREARLGMIEGRGEL